MTSQHEPAASSRLSTAVEKSDKGLLSRNGPLNVLDVRQEPSNVAASGHVDKEERASAASSENVLKTDVESVWSQLFEKPISAAKSSDSDTLLTLAVTDSSVFNNSRRVSSNSSGYGDTSRVTSVPAKPSCDCGDVAHGSSPADSYGTGTLCSLMILVRILF